MEVEILCGFQMRTRPACVFFVSIVRQKRCLGTTWYRSFLWCLCWHQSRPRPVCYGALVTRGMMAIKDAQLSDAADKE